MASAQNIIHSSSFNFEYADKAAAKRGNDLIESIFVSQILPELEKAVAKKIPDEVRIELSKLEINIGTISEKELPENLAARIRESLENALTFNFGKELKGKSIAPEGQKPDDFLIQSLEIFLLKGYFPFAFEKSLTFEELVKRVLHRNQAGLSEVLLRHRTREQAIQRIATNLSAETFDELLRTLDPVNSEWIFDFRKFLLNLKKELNLNQLSDAAFLKTANAFMLKFTLNETSLTFRKEKFSTNIWGWFINVFNPDITLIAEAINRTGGTDPVSVMAEKSLKQLQDEKSRISYKSENQSLNIKQLIELLNAGSEDFDSVNLEFLKQEILLAVQEKEKRKQLVEQLTESGASFLAELFNPEKDKTFYKLILSFTKIIAAQFNSKFSGETKKQVTHFVTEAILFWNGNAARKPDNEEFILFLIFSAGLDLSEIESSSEFQNFIKSEKSIRPEKMIGVLENERHFPEVSNICKILSKSKLQTKQDFRILEPDSFVDYELSKVYKRKIVFYFLVNGYLPEPFNRLNLREMQHIFRELIQQRDDFLASAIRKNENNKELIARVSLLIPVTTPDDLEKYFIHFFQKEFDGFSKIMNEISQQFAPEGKVVLNEKLIKNEIFMQAMAESRGQNLSSVFRLIALEFSYHHLTEDFRIPEKLPHLVGDELDETQINNALEQNLNLFVKGLHFPENGIQFSGKAVKEIIQKIAFYAHLNQHFFQEVIQKYAGKQELIFTAFKFYLPQEQWKFISKTLLPLAGFEKFQQKAELISEIIFQPNLALAEMLEQLKKSALRSNETFLLLATYDKELFEKLVSEDAEMQDFSEIQFENKKFEQYWTALRSFSPGTFSGKLKPEFWRSLVAGFGILVSADEKKFSSAIFANSFMSHLFQQLKVLNEPELFYPVIGKMQDSGSQELIELVELWKTPDKTELAVNEKTETEKQNQFTELEHHFGILEFYAQHGFLPWWAGQISLPEVVNKLRELAGKISKELEGKFLQAEKEFQIFEKLTNRIPESAWFEIERLIAGSRKLQTRWKEVLQSKNSKSKNKEESGKILESTKDQGSKIDINDFLEKAAGDSGLLFKGLYIFTDDQILNQWLKDSNEIAGQIKLYLQLAPYFYFKNISPAQWREAVYAFSLNFYQNDLKHSKSQFHVEFLKFIKTKYSRINWGGVLKSVYYTVQQPEIKQKVVFPSELVRLLNLKPGLPDHIKELNKKMETIFSDEDSGIGVKVYNAGLILFWPFLTRLFEHLSFVKNGEFVNPEIKNRAVYLLQYLIYNETDFPEYELVLNKLLTGMEPEDHLELFVTLTGEEKELANSLLHGLMNNWEKVKNSTPEGVQETFLQREGILRFKREEVSLEVEKKGVDILVKSIPWNISLIKLPWMKKPMHVEWV